MAVRPKIGYYRKYPKTIEQCSVDFVNEAFIGEVLAFSVVIEVALFYVPLQCRFYSGYYTLFYCDAKSLLFVEEHWKIEPFDPEEDFPEEKEEEEEDLPVEQEEDKVESDQESNFEPDEEAINDPKGYRINTWDETVLGKNYQEARVRKRERRQPGTIPDLPYLHWERTGQAPAGPYSALDIQTLGEYEPTSKPDVMAYTERGTSPTHIPKLPALVETLRQPVPEKEIFPKYILDFEAKMKSYHQMQLNQSQVSKGKGLMARTSLQNIGIQLGQQSLKSPPKNLKQSLKKVKPVGGSRRPSMVSTDNS
ncbi:hypothetical protein KUTeg_014571 [Tegillarca granosa]|uniref:Uncharacterized protein n=1 Tax=Tegillarca granosa TaxID=220873 RepID=A0ABQ9EV87_TEGGR|nr:hypothetical protein KUTeg_014571 [Tegillarca granosa]